MFPSARSLAKATLTKSPPPSASIPQTLTGAGASTGGYCARASPVGDFVAPCWLESDLSDTIRSMTRLTATEVARNFSRVVSRVDAGEEVEVIRNGVPIVQMRPAQGRQVVSAARWRELMDSVLEL